MRSVSVVLILVVAAMASAAPASEKPHYDVSNAKVLFENFIKKYDKSYKDDADKDAHYHAFVKTLELINEENADNGTVTLDINESADFTREDNLDLINEFVKLYLSLDVWQKLEKLYDAFKM